MTEKIQKLREATGAGVMDCKRAMEESGGDMEKAAAIIREKGLAKAEKKSERSTGAGLLKTYIHNGRVGVLLELHCETDFVSRSEDFDNLARELAMQVAAMNPENVEELLKQAYIKDESTDIDSLIKSVIAKFGENIKVEKFCRYEI
jgi:elongation factor Ts